MLKGNTHSYFILFLSFFPPSTVTIFLLRVPIVLNDYLYLLAFKKQIAFSLKLSLEFLLIPSLLGQQVSKAALEFKCVLFKSWHFSYLLQTKT